MTHNAMRVKIRSFAAIFFVTRSIRANYHIPIEALYDSALKNIVYKNKNRLKKIFHDKLKKNVLKCNLNKMVAKSFYKDAIRCIQS